MSDIDQNLKIVCLFPYPKVEFAYFVMLTYQHIPTIKGVAMTKPCWGPHTKVAFGPKWLPINKPVLRSCLCCFVCVFRESDFIQRFFDGGVVVVDPF